MEKTDIIKTVISIVIIIVLAVLVVNINKVITPKAPRIVEEQTVPTLNEPESDTAVTGGAVTEETVKDYAQCFSKDPSTIVFVHANWCPHCQKMKPIVEELQNEGYPFYFAETSDEQAMMVVQECFGSLLAEGVPQFICPKTGKEQTGGMSKDDLKKFAEDCSYSK